MITWSRCDRQRVFGETGLKEFFGIKHRLQNSGRGNLMKPKAFMGKRLAIILLPMLLYTLLGAGIYSSTAAMAATAGVITTVAGNGISGYTGDGGPATSAELDVTQGVAVDAVGNLYIAGVNHVRKVDQNGIITTVAGNGISGQSGDGGSAISAALGIGGIAVDAAGNLYIADGNRIRKVDREGIITTVAGNGNPGYSGDGGPATSAELDTPQSVAFDAHGNLYIADLFNNCIRKVDNSGIITTVYSRGKADYGGGWLPGPLVMTVDAAGNLYIVDAVNNCIRKVSKDGSITTVAGDGTGGYSGDGGPAASAEINPSGMALDASGDLYFIDGGNRIRRVDASGNIITVVGDGNPGYFGDGGPAAGAELNNPSGLALDASGNLFIVDAGNNRIRMVAAPIPSAPIGQKIIQFKLKQYFYMVSGHPFGMDALPLISNGRALVPVRFLADALGAQTTWDAAAQKVIITRGSTSVVLLIGSDTLIINGTASQMDVAAIIQDGRTYAPARFIAEAFGCMVAWNAADQTIIVSPQST
jgi:sugar lactone lactonase YvrE